MAERITVAWHENAIRTAVERLHACLNTEDSAANDVHEINGKRVTSMDLWCLLDAGRAVLAEEPAPSSSDAPNRTATLMAALIEQELELAHSGEGYEPKAVAEEIVKDHVTPVLAERDRLNREARRHMHLAERREREREVERDIALWLHAEAVRQRDKLRADLDRAHTYIGELVLADMEPPLPPYGSAERAALETGQPGTCPHGDTNCKTVLGKTVLDQPYHGNCHPWHYRLRARLNGVYGALAGQGNELAPKLRAAIGFLDESAGQPDTEATGQASTCGAVGFWGARNSRYECDKPKGHQEKVHENSSEDPSVIWFGDHSEGPVTPATPTEAELLSVFDDPEGVEWDFDEDDEPIRPHVGWDIAFGCRITISREDHDTHHITISISDSVQRDGIAVRTLDREQIQDYAHHLIELTEVPEDGAQ